MGRIIIIILGINVVYLAYKILPVLLTKSKSVKPQFDETESFYHNDLN
jgi:hypothetical protein